MQLNKIICNYGELNATNNFKALPYLYGYR
jgi:hypothetical protein